MDRNKNSMESFTRIVDEDIKQFICDRCHKTKKSKTHVNWMDKKGNTKCICNGCYGYLQSIQNPKDFNTNNIDKNTNEKIKDLIISINNSKNFTEVLELANDAISENIELNEKIFRNILNKTKTDNDILSLLKNNYIKPNKTTYREILRKVKGYETSLLIFEQAKKTIVPSQQMYEIMMYKTKDYKQIMKLFHEMKNLNIIPTESIYSILIEKNVDFYEALKLIGEMIKNKTKIRESVYNNFINLIKTGEQFNDLTKLIKSLKSNGLQLSDTINEKIINKKKEILEDKGNLIKSFKQGENDTNNIKSSSYEEELNSVKQKGNNIQNISNPSLEIQLEAVKQNGYAIRYIENPIEQVQLKAVENQGLAIRYIMNPSSRVQLEAVKQNGYAIEYILNASFDLQLEAVRTTSSSIKFIESPKLLLQLEAVRKNGLSIQFIKNPSFEVQYESVKQRGISIKYIKEPTLDIQKEAIKQNVLSIQHIKEPFEEVQLEVIQQNASYIKYMENPTEKVMMEAVRKDPFIIKYINKPTLQVQLEAVRQNKEAYEKINNPFHEVEMEFKSGDLSTIKNNKKKDRTSIKQNNNTQKNTINIEELRNRYFSSTDEKVENLSDKFFIINNNEPLDKHINFLCEEINVINIYIASGFVYKSGLKLIETSLKKALKNNGEIHLIIGSLQDYNKVDMGINYRVTGMDKTTAIYINEILNNNHIEIRTFEESFFHGKFYFLQGNEKSCVIIGSSNVSSSGFYGNKELNLLYIFEKKLEKSNEFKTWFDTFWSKCTKINEINENYFNDIEMEYDTYVQTSNIKKMEQDEVKQRINEITDEEVKKRLNLWVSKNPNNIYTDLEIESLEGYVLFEYKEYDLLVLESFDSGNAYYYFTNKDVQTLINTIKTLSKTEIFNLSKMSKRGYHIKNDNKLEISINSLFIKKYSLKKN